MFETPTLRLQSIQALRGIAAVLVLFLHVAGIQESILLGREQDVLEGWWQNGFAGVDIFFVISGFIMVYVTRNYDANRRESARFLKARVIRIYPLWWVYVVIMGLILFNAYGVPATPELAERSGGVGLYVLRSFFLLPQAEYPVLTIGWTLIFEMYFYLIFSVLIIIGRKKLALCLWIWAGLVGLLQILQLPKSPILHLITSPLSLEFIGGAFTALCFMKWSGRWSKLCLTVGTVMFALGLSFYGLDGNANNQWNRVLLFGLPAMLIIYGAVGWEAKGKAKIPKALTALGDWSYSLYLGHLIVLLVMKNVWEILTTLGLPQALQLGAQGMFDNIVFAIACICAAIMAAMLSYHLVEAPMTRALRRRWIHPLQP